MVRRFHFLTAMRDLRGSLVGFILFVTCLAIGVTTTAAISIVNHSITKTVDRDSAALLGGDFELEQANYPVADAVIEKLKPLTDSHSSTIVTNSIVFTEEGKSLTVEVKAVDALYPLYGELVTEPAGDLDVILAPGKMLVERSILLRLGLEVGDRLDLGDSTVEISGVVVNEPDRVGVFALGPRVFVHRSTLEGANILLPGAIARFQERFAIGDPDQRAAFAELSEQLANGASWRVQRAAQVQPRISRFTGTLATYLLMAGYTALLIGGAGIGLSISFYLKGKMLSIGVLRALGSTSSDIRLIYGLQIGLITLIGIVAGLILAIAIPYALAPLLSSLLNLNIAITVSPSALFLSALCGALTVLMFTTIPLYWARTTKPSVLLRSKSESETGMPAKSAISMVALIVLLFAAAVYLSSPIKIVSLWFLGGVVVLFALLGLVSSLLLFGIGKLHPFLKGKLKIAMGQNLQPGNAVLSVMVALGSGLTLLIAVGLLQKNLQNELEREFPQTAPDFVFIDIQPHQSDQFQQMAVEEGGEIKQYVPVLRGRVAKIKGIPTEEAEIGEDAQWTVRRDRGLTYRKTIPELTELVKGEWWPEDYQGPPLVSVDEDIYEGYGVDIGDTISFSFHGRLITAEIASIRKEIDWASGRLDFLFILSPGVLEDSPHNMVASIAVPEDRRGEFLSLMARQFPNVTPISVGDAITRVIDVLNKISAAISLVAAITIICGALVLTSAIVASQHHQIRRSVLFKVLGARQGDVLSILLLEHAGIGLLATLAGAILGTAASYLLIVFLMELKFTFDFWMVLLIAIGVIGATMGIAAAILRQVLKVKPAVILRNS